jgi:hypothetical protein
MKEELVDSHTSLIRKEIEIKNKRIDELLQLVRENHSQPMILFILLSLTTLIALGVSLQARSIIEFLVISVPSTCVLGGLYWVVVRTWILRRNVVECLKREKGELGNLKIEMESQLKVVSDKSKDIDRKYFEYIDIKLTQSRLAAELIDHTIEGLL